MEIDLPRIKSLFSAEKEWRYENGVLRLRFKKTIYPKIVAAILTIAIIAASITYNIKKKEIVICDAEVEKTVTTFKTTVEEVLNEKNIIVGPFDKLETSLSERLKEGKRIEIKRARSVIVNIGDKERQIYTLAETVGEAMEEAQIYLGIKDKIEPAFDTELKSTERIIITRVEDRISSEIEKIPFANEVRKNEKLDKGIVKIIKKGEEGQREIGQKVVFENGEETVKEVLWESIIKSPVAAIIEEGTRDTFISSRGTVFKFTKAMEMVATAYDASFASTGKNPDHPQYGITRSGMRVKPGVVAVDPRIIPLGTHLYVEGYGEALAADTGGAIKGNRIDLYYESPNDVAKYGKKRVKVYVLDKPRYRF